MSLIVLAQDRGFHIGLALDFGSHILAFTTLDLMIQVKSDSYLHPHIDNKSPQFYWGKSRQALPSKHLDAAIQFPEWLARVTEWISDIPYPTTIAALHWVQKPNSAFGGIGVYTGVELFYRAGKSHMHRDAVRSL